MTLFHVLFQAVHDWMLGLGVLILVFIDFVILIIFFALARNELTAESVQNRENPENNNGENNVRPSSSHTNLITLKLFEFIP